MADKVAKKIKEFGKVVETLTEFVLKLGILIAVIKMIYDVAAR